MDLRKTIKNIRATCNNYVGPDLLAFVIDDDCRMGTNNILEIEGYGIENSDDYCERLLKIHKMKNIFLPVGVMTLMPIINECDLFCEMDYNVKLTQEEFGKYASKEEKLFGILVVKDSSDYLIGKTDTCSCSIDASFEKIEKSDSTLYRKIEKIIEEKII